MTNLENQLVAWHDEHYGKAVNVPATYRKLLEEIGELGEALMRGDETEILNEAGDCAVVLFHVLRGASPGSSLHGAMAVALDKVETKAWKEKHKAKRRAKELRK